MKREDIERLIVQISTCEKGTIPFKCACDQLLVEFDRLKLKVAELEGKLWDAQDEPQQPDKSLEQKIQRIFDDNTRDADCHEACIPREYYGEVILGILALLQSQQPAGELVSDYELLRLTCDTTPEKLAKRVAEAQLAYDKVRMKVHPSEGELAPCPFLIGGTRICEKPKFGRHETCITSNCAVIEGIKAQLAHTMRSLKAQGWVKLPSEDELADMLEQVFASNTGQPHSAWPLNKIAQELRRLLFL